MSSANVLFLFVFGLGPLVATTSSNWIIVWIGVELSFLGLIPILLMGKYFSLPKESALKYFCIQALSSGILFLSGMMIFLDQGLYYELAFIFSLTLKLGLFPGHFWVPSVVSSLDWVACLLLLSWQKIPAFALLLMCLDMSSMESGKFMILLGGVSALTGGLIGNNVTNIRAMIGASSISHTGWAVVAANTGCLWFYFFLYCLVLFLSLGFLWSYHSVSSLGILSMSGLPPFVMFVAKWKVISLVLMGCVSMKYLFLPIMGTIISLIFYLKFLYSFYLNEKNLEVSVKILPLIFLNFSGLVYLLI